MRTTLCLTPDLLGELRAGEVPCASCLRWELDPVRRARVRDAEDIVAEKHAWLSSVLRDWGSCGRVLMVDQVLAGYIVYAPAPFVPGADSFATAPVSHDAVLLTTAYLTPEHRGSGLGRVLVQAMASDLIERGGVRAVEAFGRSDSLLGRAASGASSCVVESGFLAHVGFRTVRAHPVTPRMRMDLRSALTWRDEVEAALARLVGVVRPAPTPAPETARWSRDAAGPRARRPRP